MLVAAVAGHYIDGVFEHGGSSEHKKVPLMVLCQNCFKEIQDDALHDQHHPSKSRKSISRYKYYLCVMAKPELK
ncbi:hypothetical protein Ccrd_014054 [Cynara cardunculus var. scolymus]|uniref:Uncharacterized protein n=1 Tax=Cynara cardunculus var. scolymus TaxID=59895 RepID=A0A118K4I1_CYNCS|nr:hypothetical protein Ccrd_014054 [Cynara cardunculus var. scolymus]